MKRIFFWRIWVLVLVAVMILPLMGGSDMLAEVSAAEGSILGSGTCGKNLTWQLLADGNLIISGSGAMENYARNEMPWYELRSSVKHITMEKGIISIGDYAFFWCDQLTGVTIPEGVLRIGSYAFGNCWALTEVVIPNGVREIGEYAFDACDQLKKVVMPDSVGTIGAFAFANCGNLVEAALPAGITEIAEGLFSRCFHLPDITLPAGITYIGARAFEGCDAMTRFAVPEGITSIEDGTFSYCDNLTDITIPASVTSIGKEAFFANASLVSITIPESVTVIGDAAFGSCGNLAEITLPAGVTYIGEETFRECKSLTAFTIHEGITDIGYKAFQYCESLTEITIPGSVTSIGSRAFEGCSNLERVTIREGVEQVNTYAFGTCGKLVQVNIPESVTVMDSNAFENCVSLPKIVIPGSIKIIDSQVFSGCTQLQEVTLSEGLESIGGGAFQGCTGLQRITIPATVTDIASHAFAFCEGLEKVWFLGDAPDLGMYAFYEDKCNAFYPSYAAGWENIGDFYYGGNLKWFSYDQGEAPFAFTGTSISLGDSLDIHFFLSDYEVESTDYAVITRTYADDRPDHVVTVPYGEWDDLGDGRLYITYQDIAAKEMCDTISVVVYKQDGTPASRAYTDSVKDYVMRLCRSITIDGAMEIIVADLLNYGAEAQLFFGYDTENLANAELTYHDQLDASKDYLVEDHLKCSEGRAGTAITLKSRLSLDMYFKNSFLGDDFAEIYAIVQYTDHYGKPVEYRVEGTDFVIEDSYRSYVAVTGLAIADYQQLVTCTVYDRDGNVLAWATDSIEGYIARMDREIPDIVIALAKVAETAWYCFHGYIGDPLETPKIIR